MIQDYTTVHWSKVAETPAQANTIISSILGDFIPRYTSKEGYFELRLNDCQVKKLTCPYNLAAHAISVATEQQELVNIFKEYEKDRLARLQRQAHIKSEIDRLSKELEHTADPRRAVLSIKPLAAEKSFSLSLLR